MQPKMEPAQLSQRLRYIEHTDAVFAVAWSPDNNWIASGDRAGNVHIWSPQSGQCQQRFHVPQSCILSLAWSPDTHLLAGGDTAGEIHIWQLDTGLVQRIFRGHKRFVRSLAWSPDGSKLASGGDYGDSTLQIRAVANGELLAIKHDQQRIFSVAWSPDGTKLASANFARRVELWKLLADPRSPQSTDAHSPLCLDLIYSYQQHQGPVYAIGWSPIGDEIASGSEDGHVHIWQAQNHNEDGIGTLRLRYDQHRKAIKTLAWSPQGDEIASAGDDERIHIWSSRNGQHIQRLNDGNNAWIRSLSWSLNRQRRALATASDHTITVWASR